MGRDEEEEEEEEFFVKRNLFCSTKNILPDVRMVQQQRFLIGGETPKPT